MTNNPNPHKGSSVEDFLKEEDIEILCKACDKEKASTLLYNGLITMLICDKCKSLYVKEKQ